MPDEQNHLQLTRRIVGGYLRHNQLAADQLPSLISTVHAALAGLGKPVPEAVAERTPAVSIRRSITPNFVVCLDCGHRAKLLKRHLTMAHGLTADAYRARWNLPSDHALVAPAYSARRSGLAKELGFGRRGRAFSKIAMVPETKSEAAGTTEIGSDADLT